MATSLKNLSSYDPSSVPDGSKMKIGIVTSEWNIEITRALLDGACETLTRHGVKSKNILIEFVFFDYRRVLFELCNGVKVRLLRLVFLVLYL